MSKVLESLIHSQVYSYIQEAGILNEVQSGFRHGYCAQDALLKTVDDWHSGLDENKVVGVVFVDLRKAFDSIDHGLFVIEEAGTVRNCRELIEVVECY